MRGAILALAAVCGLAAAPPAAAQAESPRARGGVRLVEAMEGAGLTLVGRVESVEQLDAHGYRGELAVETAVGASGARPEGAVAIAWEELASQRAPRFAPGDRVLVVVEPLGTASIWRARIPGAEARAATAAVAMQGDAFLRDPPLSIVDLLHHYLSLAPEDRETATGVAHLVALAAGAGPDLARDAAARLARVEGLGERLTRASAERLVAALGRPDLDPRFESVWKPVLKRARGDALLAALAGAIESGRPGLAEPHLYEALAVAAGGLSAEEAAALAGHADPRYREVAARASSAPALLQKMAASDPAPEVRRAALERLLEVSGADALAVALAALADPDPEVRQIAARGAGALGDVAVPGLRSVAYGEYRACAGSGEAARAAIAGLSLAGSKARRALAQIASEHPDPSLRKLASIALGSLETHQH